MSHGRSGRLAYLDNLKVVLVAAVIVAHAAMTYGAFGSWVYEEPSLSTPVEGGLSAAIVLGAMFGLGLFYLVAGMLTPGPLARRGPRGMLSSRVIRLGAPLLAYVVIVWPVLRWITDRATGNGGSLWASLRSQFSGEAVWSLGSGPLWFVAVLLVLTIAFVLWRSVRPAPAPRAERLAPHHLAVAAGLIAVGSFLVRLAFPIDSQQFLDLHVWMWPQAAVLFVLGAVGFERGWLGALPTGTRRGCAWAVIAAAIALASMFLLSGDDGAFTGGWHWEALGLAAVEGVVAVTASLLVLDWFRRRRDRDTRINRSLGGSSYPAFVVQGPVLVGLALLLRPADIPGDVKFVALAVGGVVVSYAIAALARVVRRPSQLLPVRIGAPVEM